MIASGPGIEWDGRQRLTLDHRSFPVVLMVHPDGYRWDGPVYGNDDDCAHGWSVSIPFESGLICRVVYDVGVGSMHKADDPLTAMLSYPVWASPIDQYDTGPIMAIWDGDMYVHTQRSRRRIFDRRNTWTGCDPEWLAEHLERLARLPAERTPDGVRGQWVTSLEEAIEIPDSCHPSWRMKGAAHAVEDQLR